MVIPIVTCALGTVQEGLVIGGEEFEIGGRAETIRTTSLLRSARILSPGDLKNSPHSDSNERPSTMAGMKNGKEWNNNNNNNNLEFLRTTIA